LEGKAEARLPETLSKNKTKTTQHPNIKRIVSYKLTEQFEKINKEIEHTYINAEVTSNTALSTKIKINKIVQ
jgi:hypothetical protein